MQAPVAGAVVGVASPAEIVRAAVDVLDQETVPLKVFSWKFLNAARNSGDVHVDAAAVEFAAELEGVDDLRIELEVVPTERLRDRRRRSNGTIGDSSAERSRLKPPAL